MDEHYVPFFRPSIGDEEIDQVVDALRSGWITTGPKVKEFERNFAAAVDSDAALAVASGTGAMHVGLAALGVGPGDAVATTTMTFCSTVHVIEQVGATPLLVDVEPDTLNISPRGLEEVLESRSVKAIVPVHLHGHPCDMGSIDALAASHGAAVLEDAAHAFPARIGDRMVGCPRGDFVRLTAFSFYATKNLTTGEGGMLTGPREVLDEARLWTLHGMTRDAWDRYADDGSWFYEVVRPGFKYNMTDLQAALGLVQLSRIDELTKRHRAIAAAYSEGFADLDAIELPAERATVEHSWHLYVIRLEVDLLSIDRRRFIAELGARGVSTSVHFIPVHLHPYYRDRYSFAPEDFPVASREYERMISLPLYPAMTDAQVTHVIDSVTEVVSAYRR